MKKAKKEEIFVTRYSPDKKVGLTSEIVLERVKQGQVNNAKIKSSKSYASIFVKNIFTFFNMIWFILAVALFVVKSYADLLFLLVIVLNTAIAIFQEIRAKITVEKLSMTTLPKVKVIRDSTALELSAEELVLDDIIVLQTGDQVPSDAIIISGNVEVNESLLTGESVPVKKGENAQLYASSFLVAGKCYARVDKVGLDNYIQTIAAKAKKFKAPASNLFKDLNRLIKYIGIALVPLGIATFIKEWFKSDSIKEIVSNTSGAITGMIPAGMFLLITIALSVGVVKLARKKTLVKDIYSIEMLARTDVLCLDKTGTITDGTMTVADMINFSKMSDEEVGGIISNILAAEETENATSKALLKRFKKNLTFKIKSVTPFSSARKFSVTSFKDQGTFYLGAPTFTGVKLTKKQKDILKEQTENGLRVIALVYSSKDYVEKEGASGEKLICFITLEDHIRPDAIETIKWFKDSGVNIKIISGDDPLTVSKIAERVGIENSNKFVSLEGKTLEEVESLAEDVTIFGRVSPEQKYTLIKALKAKGHVVAMTGDGVNDTLALKEADCSIAMADGSEVARNISKLVLLDSKFSSLPSVVKEGRQVINNVQNSSTLFLMKTFFTIILCMFTLAANKAYPFAPKNLFLLELFIIGIPSFLLTFEPNDKKITGNFISTVIKKALPRTAIMLAAVIVSIFSYTYLTQLEFDTLPTFALTVTGLINLIWLCLPFSWYRAAIPALSLGFIMMAIYIMPTFFGIASMPDIAAFSPIFWIVFSAIIGGSIVYILAIKLITFLVKKYRKS